MTPLALYMHWPFCKSKCPYCDFNSHVRDSVDQVRWRAALERELETMHTHTPDHCVTSIFFGGGTPSLMPPATAAALIEKASQLWPVADEVEITLEANPTSVEAETFPAFKSAGVNRVSLGVQSFDDRELTFLGRGHSADEARRAIALAQKHFDRYSFDLIYARPHQTTPLWKQELAEALALAGGHLSLYQLTIEENTAFHHAYKSGNFALPDEEEAAALYCLTEEMTAAQGLPAYEVSNYARPGEESRHNLAYWQGDAYVGIGPGAHGRIMVDGRRITNNKNNSSVIRHPSSVIRIATSTLKSPERWLAQVEAEGHGVEVWQALDARTEMEERLMMGLRLTRGIPYHPFADIVHEGKRQQCITEGLLTDHAELLQPTLKGRLLLSALTAELLG